MIVPDPPTPPVDAMLCPRCRLYITPGRHHDCTGKWYDTFDDVHREFMQNWRYRLAYYRHWPYFRLVRWWIRFKAAVDRWLDLVDDEPEEFV